MFFRNLILIFLLNCALVAKDNPFDWEDEPAKPPANQLPTSPPGPGSNQGQILPAPSTPGSGHGQLNPFPGQSFQNDPFFQMQREFRERQKSMMDRLRNLFKDPFFQGHQGGNHPLDDPFFSGPMTPFFGRNQPRGTNPTPNSTGRSFSRFQFSGGLGEPRFIERKNLLIVEFPLPEKSQSEYKVEVQNQVLKITSVQKQSTEDKGQHGYQSFQSFSSSSQMVSLPVEVEPGLTQNIVNGKLIITLKKK